MEGKARRPLCLCNACGACNLLLDSGLANDAFLQPSCRQPKWCVLAELTGCLQTAAALSAGCK